MVERISGYRARDEYGLTVMDLAEACRAGLLKAFSPFDEKQIYSAESCTVKYRYPVTRFAVTPPPAFMVEDILFNKKTLDDFYINFDNKFRNQDINHINRKVIEIGGDTFYLYKLKDLKDGLNDETKCVETNEDKKDLRKYINKFKFPIMQNFLELKENINLNIENKHEFCIDIIYRCVVQPRLIYNIDDMFLHVKCCIEYNNRPYDNNFKINGARIIPIMDKSIVEKHEKAYINNYDLLFYLWFNTYRYFYNDIELEYDDYFIFNYEMYILHRMIYDHEEKIRGNFQKSILSFLFNKNEIEDLAYIKTRDTDNLIQENPKEYIIKIYSILLNKLKEDTKKNTLDITRIDMYIKKLQGKTNKEIIDDYNQTYKKVKDESCVSKYIGKDFKKIANKYKLPYIDWKNIIKVKTSTIQPYTNEELTKNIEEQLRRMQ